MSVAVGETRERIMKAALAFFLDEGYEQTTTAAICGRAGVSNGALFHHFSSKQAIADALYVEAIASFQDGLWALVRRRPRTLYAALHGAIGHQMAWIEAHADLARFVYMRGHLDWESEAGSEVAALNGELATALRAWMRPLAKAGEMRPLPMLLTTAVVSGPAHAIARRWLSGQLDQRPTDFVGALTEAAWAALRGAPVSGAAVRDRGTQDGYFEEPRASKMRIELLGDDGTVLARGEASAVLTPAPAPAAGLGARTEPMALEGGTTPGHDSKRAGGGAHGGPWQDRDPDDQPGRGSDT